MHALGSQSLLVSLTMKITTTGTLYCFQFKVTKTRLHYSKDGTLRQYNQVLLSGGCIAWREQDSVFSLSIWKTITRWLYIGGVLVTF